MRVFFLLREPELVFLTLGLFFLAPAVVAASVGGSEGFSSHREGQRPQRLQEAAQDQDQRSGALHQVRYQQICFVCFPGWDYCGGPP